MCVCVCGVGGGGRGGGGGQRTKLTNSSYFREVHTCIPVSAIGYVETHSTQ